DRPRYAQPLLFDPHAGYTRRHHRPDHAASVSRRTARSLLAAVVEGGCGCRMDRGRGAGARAGGSRAARSPRRRGQVTSQEDRRAGFARYKRDVKVRGKPFYPFAMFHDTVMSLVVVLVIIALAAIWRYTPDFAACTSHHIADKDCTKAGWLGPLYEAKADPGTTTFV